MTHETIERLKKKVFDPQTNRVMTEENVAYVMRIMTDGAWECLRLAKDFDQTLKPKIDQMRSSLYRDELALVKLFDTMEARRGHR